MKNHLCCVVIPIYKKDPSKIEVTSLRQCLRVLSKYQIIFVTHCKLDCSFYTRLCGDYGVSFSYEYFSPFYFMDVFGYNALLLLKNFYVRFIKYKYMLIYQLDAYVFRDELEYWCSQDYDFIGAPWITPQIITEHPVFGNRFGVIVGNGGFSLRKIDVFIRLYSSKIACMATLSLLIAFFNLLAQKSRLHIGLMAIRLLFFPIKKVCDIVGIILDDAKHEDIIWAKLMLEKNGNIPSSFTSLQFAFELYADYLYELNNGKLPFGCHAWPEYYCWHLIWKKFITLET